jgi:hypothetical protein
MSEGLSINKNDEILTNTSTSMRRSSIFKGINV